jgi:D-alanyl-D-alanine carboxypeptidase (penicillin-binding protein 5/6)
MFEWAFDTFRLQTATSAGEAVTGCKVRLGRGTDYVTLVTADDIPILLPANVDMSAVETEIHVEDSYDAPIAKGEVLGTVTYSFDGIECATADLIALTEVDRSTILFALDQIAKFLSLTVVRVVIVVIIVVYLALVLIARRNRRMKNIHKNKKHKRYKK